MIEHIILALSLMANIYLICFCAIVFRVNDEKVLRAAYLQRYVKISSTDRSPS